MLKAGKRSSSTSRSPRASRTRGASRSWRKETGTPIFTTSSVRFHPDIPRMRDDESIGKVTRVQANYQLNIVPFHPDLFYYGIHGVEALYAVMGTGCDAAHAQGGGRQRRHDAACGRMAGSASTTRLLKADAKQPVLDVDRRDGHASTGARSNYDGLVAGHRASSSTPAARRCDIADTLEIFEFMTAAQISKEKGGAAVKLADLRR